MKFKCIDDETWFGILRKKKQKVHGITKGKIYTGQIVSVARYESTDILMVAISDDTGKIETYDSKFFSIVEE